MKDCRNRRVASIVGVCTLAGAGQGIAGSAAAPAGNHASTATERGPHFGIAMRVGGVGGPPVHSDLVVPNQAGNGFDTITSDRGTYKSLSGNQLTLTEGTKSATYQVVTLTIPSDAKVYRNGAAASLSDLQSGDEVNVLKSPKGTLVDAADAQHQGTAFGP